mmetsp:Transcript_14605/g.47017  ORF Transcript_14605/g.47017 Transcript_14605/m.47017 type:complete len:228 (-) Transcript_14605:388-1071(-)
MYTGRLSARRSRPLDLRSARRAGATNIRALDLRPGSTSRRNAVASRALDVGSVPDSISRGNAVASRSLDVGSDGTTDDVRSRTGGGLCGRGGKLRTLGQRRRLHYQPSVYGRALQVGLRSLWLERGTDAGAEVRGHRAGLQFMGAVWPVRQQPAVYALLLSGFVQLVQPIEHRLRSGRMSSLVPPVLCRDRADLTDDVPSQSSTPFPLSSTLIRKLDGFLGERGEAG